MEKSPKMHLFSTHTDYCYKPTLMLPHENITISELSDGDLTTCLPMPNAQVPSPSVIHSYEISWNVSGCTDMISIAVTESFFMCYYRLAVAVHKSYDSITSPVRRYEMCKKENDQQINSNQLRTRTFNCRCATNCFIKIVVGTSFATRGMAKKIYVCEISIV